MINITLGFRLECDNGNGFELVAELEENETEYIYSSRNDTTDYLFRVTAFTSYNNSDYSNTYDLFPTVSDIDGNTYEVKKIGNQVWMTENLKVTHYNDGFSINSYNGSWIEFGVLDSYCFYNNNSGNDDFGLMYTGWLLSSGRSVAPEGWHLPTDAEWQELVDYLGGSNLAGDNLKESGTEHWAYPTTPPMKVDSQRYREGGTTQMGLLILDSQDIFGHHLTSIFMNIGVVQFILTTQQSIELALINPMQFLYVASGIKYIFYTVLLSTFCSMVIFNKLAFHVQFPLF